MRASWPRRSTVVSTDLCALCRCLGAALSFQRSSECESQMTTGPFFVSKLTDMMPGVPWGADQSMWISGIGLAT